MRLTIFCVLLVFWLVITILAERVNSRLRAVNLAMGIRFVNGFNDYSNGK